MIVLKLQLSSDILDKEGWMQYEYVTQYAVQPYGYAVSQADNDTVNAPVLVLKFMNICIDIKETFSLCSGIHYF